MTVAPGNDHTFILPLRWAGEGETLHNLHIDWGDGTSFDAIGTAGITSEEEGVTHTYPDNQVRTITITGTSRLRNVSWHNSYSGFGFYNSYTGCNAQTNRDKVLSISGDLSSLYDPDTWNGNYYFWCAFYYCTNMTSAMITTGTIKGSNSHQQMFHGCSKLVDVPYDMLPSMLPGASAYNQMFNGCVKLRKSPELPATEVQANIYSNMFEGCVEMVEGPPILPATTLKASCYQNMFNNCWALVVAPWLPATTLINYCYYGMFTRCRSLQSIRVGNFVSFPNNSYAITQMMNLGLSGSPVTCTVRNTGWNAWQLMNTTDCRGSYTTLLRVDE
jgi:hypothetical protein